MQRLTHHHSPHLKPYKVLLPWQVIWGDLDAFGHVNNVRYFRYFETVRVQHFEAAKIPCGSSATVSLAPKPIIASLGCKFRRALTYPDELVLAARVTSLQRDRFVLEHVVYSSSQDALVAIGEGVVMAYDYHQKQKVELPEEWVTAIKDLDGVSLTTGSKL